MKLAISKFHMAFVALPALAAMGQAEAAPVTYYSEAFTQRYAASLPHIDPATGLGPAQQSRRTDGGLVSATQLTAADEGVALGQASAVLSSGMLRARSELTSNASDGAIAAVSMAALGDSFRAFSHDAPHAWSSSDVVTFSIDVSGLFVGDDRLGNRKDASITFSIFEAGALDAFYRWNTVGIDLDEREELFDEWNSKYMTYYEVAFGDKAQYPDMYDRTIENIPASFDVSFSPGMDFDIVISLVADVEFGWRGEPRDAGEYLLADFSNTVLISYTGPAGTETRSASGKFPGTVAFGDPPLGVPEPATLAIFGLGLTMLLAARRRPAPRGGATG